MLTVLAPTDFSTNSRAGLRFALQWSTFPDRNVYRPGQKLFSKNYISQQYRESVICYKDSVAVIS